MWLIWRVISTGARSQVPTQFTDYAAGRTGGGPAGETHQNIHDRREGWSQTEEWKAVGVCERAGDRRQAEGHRQTDSRWDSAGLEVGPHSHVWCAWRWPLTGDTLGWVWNWKPVEHSWLLKASLWELQFLPTVKEWERGSRVNCRLRPTSLPSLINNNVWLNKTSAGLSALRPGQLVPNMHHQNICRTSTSASS